LDLSLYLLAFCDDLAQGERHKHCECFVSGSSHTATIKVLNFTSGLTAQFRIVRTVTNLQQDVWLFRRDQYGAETLHAAKQSGIKRTHRLPKS